MRLLWLEPCCSYKLYFRPVFPSQRIGSKCVSFKGPMTLLIIHPLLRFCFVESCCKPIYNSEVSSGPTSRAPQILEILQATVNSPIKWVQFSFTSTPLFGVVAFNVVYIQLLPSLEGIIYFTSYLLLLVMQRIKPLSTIARQINFSLILQRPQSLQHFHYFKVPKIACTTSRRMTRPSVLATDAFELIETPVHAENMLACLHHLSKTV
jgi:hypothetical protein